MTYSNNLYFLFFFTWTFNSLVVFPWGSLSWKKKNLVSPKIFKINHFFRFSLVCLSPDQRIGLSRPNIRIFLQHSLFQLKESLLILNTIELSKSSFLPLNLNLSHLLHTKGIFKHFSWLITIFFNYLL